MSESGKGIAVLLALGALAGIGYMIVGDQKKKLTGSSDKPGSVSYYSFVGIANYRGEDTVDSLKAAKDLENLGVQAASAGTIQVKASTYSMRELKVGDTFTVNGVAIKLMKVTKEQLT